METSFLVLEGAFAVLMYVGILVSYLLPLKLVRGESANESEEKLIRRCNCIGAGIFVAICFLGLLPLVNDEFARFYQEAGLNHVNYPFPEFTVLIGFFLVLFLEQLVLICKSRKSPPVLHLDDELTTDQSRHLLLDEAAEDVIIHESSVKTGGGGGEADGLSVDVKNGKGRKSLSQSHSHHGHSHGLPAAGSTDSTLTFFILMFATSVHSVFEGLALGLIKDQSKAIHIFIGIILHECLVAFALGINSARIDCSFKSNLKFGLIFSSTVPLGIVLGIAVGYTPGAFGRLISAIFQGLAAGTFLHVAFVELIPVELDNDLNDSSPTKKLSRIFLIFIGFVLMALLTLLTDH